MIKELQQYKEQVIYLYKEIVRSSKNQTEIPHYRIVKMPDEHDKKISFQIINKNLIARLLPEELMRSDLLTHFSRTEIAIISHLGTKNELIKDAEKKKNNLFKVICQKLVFGKTKFFIEKENGEVIEREAMKIIQDIDLIDKISGKDGVNIGYTAAQEHYNLINKLKK